MGLAKTDKEIKNIAVAGKILAHVLKTLEKATRPGVLPTELDEIARKLIESSGAVPGFLNYQPDGASKPYPATICCSVNDVVVHGTPKKTPLKNGDVVSIDCGVVYEGYNADAAFTVVAGKNDNSKIYELIDTTKKALYRGIRAAKPGATIGDIGYAIGSFSQEKGFSVVQGLTGHGIGKKLHEDPYIPNTGKRGEGVKLEKGMVLALEPMLCLGSGKIVQTEDEGYATSDGSLAAHFEHTIVITEKGANILTA